MGRHKFGDLEIRVNKDKWDYRHPKSRVYTSMSSDFLPTYKDAVMRAEDFDTDESLSGLNEGYMQNYRRFLGFRNIHLGNLSMTGFHTNKNYDIAFGFSVDQLLKQRHLVAEREAIMHLLLYGEDAPISGVFKENYEPGDELLVRTLDLKKANQILIYSEKAEKKVEENNLLKNIERYNLSEIRNQIHHSLFGPV